MSPEPHAVAIVLAAGAGRRLGAELPKALLPVGDRPMLAIAAAAAAASPAIAAVVVAAPEGYEDVARGCLERLGVPSVVVSGGATRQASVRAALDAIEPGVAIVAVHDAARPFAPPDLFTEVIRAVEEGADGAVPIVPMADTVKRIVDGRIEGTIDRDGLGLAQTPQAFRVDALTAAHARAAAEGRAVTDDAALLEGEGRVVAIPGDPMNFKVTTLMDLARAEARMERR